MLTKKKLLELLEGFEDEIPIALDPENGEDLVALREQVGLAVIGDRKVAATLLLE